MEPELMATDQLHLSAGHCEAFKYTYDFLLCECHSKSPCNARLAPTAELHLSVLWKFHNSMSDHLECSKNNFARGSEVSYFRYLCNVYNNYVYKM